MLPQHHHNLDVYKRCINGDRASSHTTSRCPVALAVFHCNQHCWDPNSHLHRRERERERERESRGHAAGLTGEKNNVGEQQTQGSLWRGQIWCSRLQFRAVHCRWWCYGLEGTGDRFSAMYSTNNAECTPAGKHPSPAAGLSGHP